MSKELFEHLTGLDVNWLTKMVEIEYDDYLWLIGQAERVEELASQIKKEKKVHKKTRQHFKRHKQSTSENWRVQRATRNESIANNSVLEKFREENKRYREVLESLSELGHIEECLEKEVIQVARKALDKEIPQKVEKNEYSSQACPTCKTNVNGKYCSFCGQRISYSY